MSAADASENVESSVDAVKNAGIAAIGRYYSSSHQKRLTRDEALAISAAGLEIFVVFEDGAAPALTFDRGVRDAQIALAQASAVQQPANTAIYFALDSELGDDALAGVRAYFSGIAATVAGKYKLGVYADGLVCGALLDDGTCSYAWLSASSSFPGTHDFYASKRWALAQSAVPKTVGEVQFDLDETDGDFGGFTVT